MKIIINLAINTYVEIKNWEFEQGEFLWLGSMIIFFVIYDVYIYLRIECYLH